MKRNNGFIPGIKPGKPTADYIDTIMSRITLPGSLFIAFIAVMPAFASLLGVPLVVIPLLISTKVLKTIACFDFLFVHLQRLWRFV